MDEYESNKITLLAANAVGLKLQYSDNVGDWSTGEPYGKDDARWNPLIFNDQAFSLMIKLGISLEPSEDAICAITRNHANVVIEKDIQGDLEDASRKAIVRAAATMTNSSLSSVEIDQIKRLIAIYE